VAAIALAGFSPTTKAEDPEIVPGVTLPDGSKTQEGAVDEEGKWVLPDGTITYHVKEDGGLDWYTYSGFKRYHDVGGCQQCHGPAGQGSSYAPELVKSLQTMDFATFLGIVYVYLRARSQDAVGVYRPNARTRDPKPEQAKIYEKECFE
jgi:mono/diheme cytochrome c family protein